jgi:hypothetical protein
VRKIYIDGSGRKAQDRHVHLFNDALIYSQKLIGPYKFKVRTLRFFNRIGPELTTAPFSLLQQAARLESWPVTRSDPPFLASRLNLAMRP